METDIKRDQYGYIDTNYYVHEAHRLRSEAAAKMGRALGAKVKGMLRTTPSRLTARH